MFPLGPQAGVELASSASVLNAWCWQNAGIYRIHRPWRAQVRRGKGRPSFSQKSQTHFLLGSATRPSCGQPGPADELFWGGWEMGKSAALRSRTRARCIHGQKHRSTDFGESSRMDKHLCWCPTCKTVKLFLSLSFAMIIS